MTNLDINESVRLIVGLKEKFETQDDLSFGISTIWVEDFKEISEILNQSEKRNREL